MRLTDPATAGIETSLGEEKPAVSIERDVKSGIIDSTCTHWQCMRLAGWGIGVLGTQYIRGTKFIFK